MATQLKLRSDIKKLKKAIETKGISVSIKDKLKLQLEKAENELATLKSTGKAPKKSSVAGTKTALTSLQKLVQKNKKYAKYRGAGVDLKKDAGEPALKTGRRESKGLKANQYGSAKENKGNVYYEYRANRIDVKQPPKRYPKLEDGGMMAEGGFFDKKEDVVFKFQEGEKIKVLQYSGGKLKPLEATIYKQYAAEQPDGTYYPFYWTVGSWEDFEEGKKHPSLYAEDELIERHKNKPKMADGGMMADGGSTDVVNAEISTIKTNIMGTVSFVMKIKGMKKPQEFIVYPISADQAGKPIMIQSDTRIGFLDLSSGRGLMSQSHPNGAYGYHFQMDKKVPFKINETDLQRLKDKISGTSGSSVGTKGIISDNSGANMMASGGMMSKGGGTSRIVMIPTYIVKEIKESVDMGYDTLVEGMIGRKRKGVMLINKDYEVRGTYDIGLKSGIEDLIKKIKSGNFKVDAVDKYADGGMMAQGGSIKNQYANKSPEEIWDYMWTSRQKAHFLSDHAELLDEDRRENDLGYSRIVQADYTYKQLTPHTKKVLQSHIQGGQYASGGYMDNGGINDEGQLKVINLGGDRYDGGLFYEIRKESVVQRGTIDGEEKIKYHGKEYDGLKSLAEGIGAKLVIIPEEMKHGGVISHNHKLD